MKRFMLVCTCLLLVTGGLLHAQHRRHGEGPPGGGRQTMGELKLTDSQKDQFEKLRVDHRRRMIDTRAALGQKRLDMHEMMRAAKPDRAAIEKGLKAVSDVQYQQKLDWVAHWFAVNDILTPEQQKIWKKHRGPMGRDMPGPGGRMGMKGRMNDRDDGDDDDGGDGRD